MKSIGVPSKESFGISKAHLLMGFFFGPTHPCSYMCLLIPIGLDAQMIDAPSQATLPFSAPTLSLLLTRNSHRYLDLAQRQHFEVALPSFACTRLLSQVSSRVTSTLIYKRTTFSPEAQALGKTLFYSLPALFERLQLFQYFLLNTCNGAILSSASHTSHLLPLALLLLHILE